MSNEASSLEWRKSSYSEAGNCVEVAIQKDGELVAVRDSKNPGGGVLFVPPQAWQSFIQMVRLQ